MKMHSFVRENIPKVLNFNNKKGIVIYVLFTVIEILPYDNNGTKPYFKSILSFESKKIIYVEDPYEKVWRDKYRITAILKVETGIIANISVSSIGRAGIFVIISVEAFRSEVIVYICDVIVCFTSGWPINLQ